MVYLSLLQDVEKITWKLKTDEEGVIQGSYADFKGVLDARRDCFKKVRSTLIHGVVVTHPGSNVMFISCSFLCNIL
jgi:hypothetical protein